VIATRLVSPCLNGLFAACGAMALLAAAPASAQVAFPAPLPGQAAPPPQTSPFPPVGASGAPAQAPMPFPSQGVAPMSGGFSAAPQGGPPPGAQNCMNEFLPLRKEAERRAEVIKGLGKRKAPASEACKAIGAFSQAELKMIKYVRANAKRCGIPDQAAEQMAAGHKNTEQMHTKVCNVAAQQQQRGPAGPSLSEALGASTALPEATPTKRGGGSTFDTISGNVLAR
jgi:hypothetical protein